MATVLENHELGIIAARAAQERAAAALARCNNAENQNELEVAERVMNARLDMWALAQRAKQ